MGVIGSRHNHGFTSALESNHILGAGRESPVAGLGQVGFGLFILESWGEAWGASTAISRSLRPQNGTGSSQAVCVAQIQFFLPKCRQLSWIRYGLLGGSLVAPCWQLRPVWALSILQEVADRAVYVLDDRQCCCLL